LSWNTELGLRSRLDAGLNFEVTGFYMDFSNQIIPISESSGGNGSGLVNGGRSSHSGIEGALQWMAGHLFLPKGHELNLTASATWVKAIYNMDRWITTSENPVNIKGNRTPYAPEMTFYGAIQYITPYGLQLRLAGNYTSAQFSDELNTVAPSPDGRTGEIPHYFTLDGNIRYEWSKAHLAFSLNVKNLTDERNLLSRRPQGIRVGLPRFINIGMEWRF
jgi:Fe(3+) dicitrate transport protein